MICLRWVALAVLAAAVFAVAEKPTKPNIVFIMGDDLGYADLGYHGSTTIPTPNIDALAAGGVKLESFYGMPLCTPSRAALMTGRYPMRFGLQSFVITPGQTYGLPVEELTLAQALKGEGYKTHAVGKWHLGHADRKFWPTSRGFDHFYGNVMGEVDYWDKSRGGVVDWQRDGVFIKEEGYITTLLTAEAERVIAAHDTSAPLFLYMAHLAAHSPYEAPEEAVANFSSIEDVSKRTYSAMIALMDQSVGAVVRALEQKGIRDNTLIVFASDNGGVSSYSQLIASIRGVQKPTPASNYPFRDAKASLYEGGVRVSALANFPGKIPAGSVVNQPLSMIDWFPTFLSLAQGDLATVPNPLDGKDIWPVLAEGAKSPHEELLINVELHRGALRIGDMKLVKMATLPGKTELFDLSADPSETTDVSLQHADLRLKMEKRLNKYASEAVLSLYLKQYLPVVMRDTKVAKLASPLDYDNEETDEEAAHLPGAPAHDGKGKGKGQEQGKGKGKGHGKDEL